MSRFYLYAFMLSFIAARATLAVNANGCCIGSLYGYTCGSAGPAQGGGAK